MMSPNINRIRSQHVLICTRSNAYAWVTSDPWIIGNRWALGDAHSLCIDTASREESVRTAAWIASQKKRTFWRATLSNSMMIRRSRDTNILRCRVPSLQTRKKLHPLNTITIASAPARVQCPTSRNLRSKQEKKVPSLDVVAWTTYPNSWGREGHYKP